MTIRIGIAMALMGVGLLVIALSIFGLFRLKNVLERIHAGALTDTMGLFFVLAGLVVLYGLSWSSAKLILLLVILWAINPVTSHLVARMELVTGEDIEPDYVMEEEELEL